MTNKATRASQTVVLKDSDSCLIDLIPLYENTRRYSESICDSLTDEDLQAQSMPEASPLKWHLAHTSWAFETFILKPNLADYQDFDPNYEYLFNSYYNAIGNQYPRPNRGLLTRPTRYQVESYRRHVDQGMQELFNQNTKDSRLHALILLCIHHEQQHQELMLTDFKHLLSFNPLNIKTMDTESKLESIDGKAESFVFEGGLTHIGHRNETFYFDNEGPQHSFYLHPFTIDKNLISNEEFIEFIEDKGYQRSEFWLSEAWYNISQQNISHPLYWRFRDGLWQQHTLSGTQAIEPHLPVTHISYFEASAFANWKNKRLPSEFEWEHAARNQPSKIKGLFNQLWQWTSSSYAAYPGFKVAEGAIGEYNGKFMVNQYVLRGGSIATPDGHIRPSYRNFFYPDASWQFTGIRLADSLN
ncbi:MAG: ergothioneine biosynthesis protein EgtB [Kangiellaceae bacterium]|nr:ergothioneine biosynthesis protein EgtB [Kangiellaceae bacterium]